MRIFLLQKANEEDVDLDKNVNSSAISLLPHRRFPRLSQGQGKRQLSQNKKTWKRNFDVNSIHAVILGFDRLVVLLGINHVDLSPILLIFWPFFDRILHGLTFQILLVQGLYLFIYLFI